jgi:hypothetical protein
MEIGIEIVTDRKVALRFDEFPAEAHANLKAAITQVTERLRDMVEGAAPKRTGKLASEIEMSVKDYPDRISGIVSVRGDTQNENAKAGAEEYGAHGVAHVKEHPSRRTDLSSKISAPSRGMVKAYNRRVNITARNYLRDPLHEIEGDALAAMHEAVDKAAAL